MFVILLVIRQSAILKRPILIASSIIAALAGKMGVCQHCVLPCLLLAATPAQLADHLISIFCHYEGMVPATSSNDYAKLHECSSTVTERWL
jgi:hypothetical protein